MKNLPKNLAQFMLFLGMPIVFAFAFGFTPLAWFFVSVAVLLGIAELVCIKIYGKTISRMFCERAKVREDYALIYKAILIVGMLGLVWHFSGCTHAPSKMNTGVEFDNNLKANKYKVGVTWDLK